MAGAEGIGVQPVDQVYVLYIQTQIQPSSVEGRILMLSKALKVKWLSIDEKPGSLHLYRTDSKGFLIDVLPEGETGRIQIRRPRPGPPEPGCRDGDPAGRTLGLCHPVSLHVQNLYMDISLPFCLRLIGQDAVCPDNRRRQSQVADAGNRGRVEPHRPIDARIVKEIEIRKIRRLSPPLRRLH